MSSPCTGKGDISSCYGGVRTQTLVWEGGISTLAAVQEILASFGAVAGACQKHLLGLQQPCPASIGPPSSVSSGSPNSGSCYT